MKSKNYYGLKANPENERLLAHYRAESGVELRAYEEWKRLGMVMRHGAKLKRACFHHNGELQRVWGFTPDQVKPRKPRRKRQQSPVEAI